MAKRKDARATLGIGCLPSNKQLSFGYYYRLRTNNSVQACAPLKVCQLLALQASRQLYKLSPCLHCAASLAVSCFTVCYAPIAALLF